MVCRRSISGTFIFKIACRSNITNVKRRNRIRVMKEKLNMKSIMETELVVVDDASSIILRTEVFLEAQGYKVKQNILYQDKKSTILLQENEKNSSSKSKRHLNI